MKLNQAFIMASLIMGLSAQAQMGGSGTATGTGAGTGSTSGSGAGTATGVDSSVRGTAAGDNPTTRNGGMDTGKVNMNTQAGETQGAGYGDPTKARKKKKSHRSKSTPSPTTGVGDPSATTTH